MENTKKEAKRRRLEGISSPSSQENSPGRLGGDSDSFKSPENQERKSKLVEHEKEKDFKIRQKTVVIRTR
ncbi:hypothetical protein OS493_026292 [Desmophyllum pertusum]|uniref:Uncharacterized protein n=1 Tax=Desmophyllum pertusum TaxID=174260 RepID=A0A9W9ZL75_9CNID|nr:hypothetical protein OS493_026292 [Desmophyllum pertusum]